MDINSYALTAGDRIKIGIPGKFFQLIESGAPLDIQFERNGVPVGEIARDVEGGYVREPGDWNNPAEEFSAVILTSSVNQSIRAGISYYKGDYRRVVGIVSVQTPNDGETFDDQTVGSGAAVEVVPANASRGGAVIVQNVEDAGGGVVRVALGVVATATRGKRLQPGMSVSFHTTAAVSAIAETTDVDVSVTEETRT